MPRSTSGIAVKTQRVWGSRGYTKEVATPVATVSMVTALPMSTQAAAVVSEGEGERAESEKEGSEADIESPSKAIAAVSL